MRVLFDIFYVYRLEVKKYFIKFYRQANESYSQNGRLKK